MRRQPAELRGQRPVARQRLGVTKPFYDRFTPAIASSDFTLRPYGLERALDFLAVCLGEKVHA